MLKRNVVLIDLSNLYYCCRTRYRKNVDYRKLIKLINDEMGGFTRAIAYGSQIDTEAEGFKTFLRHRGIEPKYRNPQIYREQDGTVNRKADWDVGIAMDAVRMVDTYDTLILVTADGDMAELVKWVQEKGRQVIVIGSGISIILRQTANRWIEINETLLGDSNEPVDQRHEPENLDILESNKRDNLSEPNSTVVTARSE